MIKNKAKIFAGDFFGGLNSAIIALPQALAFGVATGFGAVSGVWGIVILCFVAGVLGAKMPLISGITGPVTIVIASIMHALNADVSSVLLIILMAGFLQIVFSMTSLYQIVKYVPYPVISGFMNGIGVIIIIMQLNPILGHSVMPNTISSMEAFFHNIFSINPHALFIGLLTLLIVFAVPKKISRIVPTQAIALILCTFISIKMGLNVEKIPSMSLGLPSFSLPNYNLHHIITYFHYAITLAIVMSAESLLTLLVSESLLKTRSAPQKMLFSQGAGNIVCGLFGALPGSAATMRTVAAINSGATTKLACVINPLIILFLMFKLSAFVSEIPLAVLAGILIKIGYDIIDVKLLKVIKFAPKDDLYVLFLVFVLTVFYNLIVAVGAGITCAALLYAKRIADSATLVHKNVYDEDIATLERVLEEDCRHKIRIVHIDGQFFFGSATQLVAQFEEVWGTEYLILDYNSTDTLDVSAIFALEDIIIRLQAQKIEILLCLNNEQVAKQLFDHGILEQIGENKVFYNKKEAVLYAKNCLARKA